MISIRTSFAQGRNYLFVTPLTSFNFGNWKTMEDYVSMSCEHFSNSMHVVFDQVRICVLSWALSSFFAFHGAYPGLQMVIMI